MSSLTPSIQYFIGSSSQYNKARIRNKRHKAWKGCYYSDNVTVNLKVPRNLPKKPPKSLKQNKTKSHQTKPNQKPCWNICIYQDYSIKVNIKKNQYSFYIPPISSVKSVHDCYTENYIVLLS